MSLLFFFKTLLIFFFTLYVLNARTAAARAQVPAEAGRGRCQGAELELVVSRHVDAENRTQAI